MDQPWIYLVLVGIAIIVMARSLPQQTGSGQQESLPKEIEETLTLFAAEMEQDNEKLLQTIAGTKSEQQQHIRDLQLKLEQLQASHAKLESKVEYLTGRMDTPEGIASPAMLARETPAPGNADPNSSGMVIHAADAAGSGAEDKQPDAIRTRYAELFALREQGKSVENIARKLGMNKGEVDLIIQLAKREESAS
ncbi:DUF6115 domain-containing protein [Paenibacillus senegalensis]|uniref:DUF6115 domain-containing protein n=1 Tax=Paenibacillus senegalensis TaxID=1465766 RepID=UPI0011DE4AA7|nr:hypothetical protein [Paenibacillus senegalensis]